MSYTCADCHEPLEPGNDVGLKCQICNEPLCLTCATINESQKHVILCDEHSKLARLLHSAWRHARSH